MPTGTIVAVSLMGLGAVREDGEFGERYPFTERDLPPDLSMAQALHARICFDVKDGKHGMHAVRIRRIP